MLECDYTTHQIREPLWIKYDHIPEFVLALVELLLSLGLTLSLVLADKVWWAVLDKIAGVVETRPLGQTIRNVHDTLAIEHVASEHVVRMMIENMRCDKIAYLGLKLALSSSVLRWTKLGKSKIMFLPSSMMGLWQKEQRTLQGSLCSIDFSLGSYHSRSTVGQ